MSSVDRRRFFGSAMAGAAAVAAGGVLAGADTARADEKPVDVGSLGKTPHTRFAVNLEMWWTGLPFLDRIKKAAEFGYPAYEFWPWEGKDLEAIKRLNTELNLDVAQFTAWGFNPGMNNPENHKNFVKAVEKGCEVAKFLNCKMMCVVGGDDQPGMTQEQMHENIITALKMAAPVAEKNDVMLILEPMNIRVDHKGHCLYGSVPAVRICREVGSTHVKINWDLYHMHISEGDLCGHLREGYDQMGYLQLADHPGRNEPGTGEIHYNRVLKEAHDLGYRGYVGLECRPTEELIAAQRVAAADVW